MNGLRTKSVIDKDPSIAHIPRRISAQPPRQTHEKSPERPVEHHGFARGEGRLGQCTQVTEDSKNGFKHLFFGTPPRNPQEVCRKRQGQGTSSHGNTSFSAATRRLQPKRRGREEGDPVRQD